MTMAAASDAVTYNQRQGFSTPEIAFIQRIVGATVDGEWGPATVAAVERWQQRQGLAADGKIRRSTSGETWPALLQAGADTWSEAAPGITRVGLWTFHNSCDPHDPACDADLQTAIALGLTDIVFTITNIREARFNLLVGVDDIVEAGRRFKERGVDVGVNSFLFPGADYVDALADAVLTLHARLGLRRLDIDAEELWTQQGTTSDRERAAAQLGERLRGAPFAVAVNGIVEGHLDRLDPLVRQDCVTHVTPQAYSLAGMQDSQGRANAVYNPIDLQTHGAARWREMWPDRTMIGGFETDRQGGRYELGTLSDGVALGLVLRTWADLGVREVCGWSTRGLSADTRAVLSRRRSTT